MAFAALAMKSLIGCTHIDGRDAPLSTNLPPKPSFMAPVAKPAYDRDARVAARQAAGALKKANTRLVKSGQWYDGVREGFSK